MITKICKNPSPCLTLVGTSAHILNTYSRTAQSIIQVNEIIENLWGYCIESLWMERKRRPQTTRKVCVRELGALNGLNASTYRMEKLSEYDDVTFKFIMCWKGLQVVESLSSKKSAERTSERSCLLQAAKLRKKLQRAVDFAFSAKRLGFSMKRSSFWCWINWRREVGSGARVGLLLRDEHSKGWKATKKPAVHHKRVMCIVCPARKKVCSLCFLLQKGYIFKNALHSIFLHQCSV